MNTKLPWGGIFGGTGEEAMQETVDTHATLGLYHVTGPYQLEAFAVAKTGQEAIMALTHGESAQWARARVFDDQCQAEYVGQGVLPRKLWNHFLAEIESPFGLVLQKAL